MNDTPDVSVVLISYNDAARLERALKSVRNQTLRNLEIIVVDDASTDDTASLVALHMREDSRIRYICLPQNSGGCSAPRNAGMREARAPWLMFCDSDDEYERHACKNLLLAAERLDADVVCGMAVRVDARTGKIKAWRPEVHESEAVADGLAAFPDLLYDTISVNKIYRRSLIEQQGLVFPEGLLFEDQLFTLEAMALSPRVAVIPEVVYRWYVDRLSEDRSITQSRAEIRNVESRIEINRRIDAFLARQGLDAIRETKDVKFLRHDLHLYFASILDADDDVARALMECLVPYVETVDLSAAWKIRPLSKVAIYHLLIGELDHLRDAMTFLRWASVVSTPVREIGGRQIWCCGHEHGGPDVAGMSAHEWLDVTSLDLVHVPFVERRYLHQVTDVQVEDGALSVSGWTFDYLDDIEVAETKATLCFTADSGVDFASAEIDWIEREGGRISWRTRGELSTSIARPLVPSDRGGLSVRLDRHGLLNTTAVRHRVGETGHLVRFPGDTTGQVPDAFALVQHDYGVLGWKAGRSAPRARSWATYERRLRNPFMRLLMRGPAGVRTHLLVPLVAWLGGLMPRKDIVMCWRPPGEIDPGRAAVIAQALVDRDDRLTLVWVSKEGATNPPARAKVLVPGTVRHAWLQARARVRLDDGTGEVSTHRSGCTVFTGTGPRLTREGLDDPDTLASPGGSRTARARGRSWDFALASGPADARALRSAWNYKGSIAETGLPELTRSLGAQVGLPSDRPVVVYAPAHRDFVSALDFDVDVWNSELGRQCYLVMCTPDDVEIPTRLRSAIRLTRESPTSFIPAAAVVVADYGSSVGWALALGKPVVLYQPDRDQYVRRQHGLYDSVNELGPVVTSQEHLMAEVVRALGDPDSQGRYEPGRSDYVAQWCGDMFGDEASDAAVKAVLAAIDGGKS